MSACPDRRPSLVLATNIWYALCFQLRSWLSLCQDRCGVSVSMPRGFSRYSQRKTTGVAEATEVNRADTASTTISLRHSTELLRGPAGHSNEMIEDSLQMAGMVSLAPCGCQPAFPEFSSFRHAKEAAFKRRVRVMSRRFNQAPQACESVRRLTPIPETLFAVQNAIRVQRCPRLSTPERIPSPAGRPVS